MAEPISIQQLKDASEDAITLADFIYKPANVTIPRRLAADINSLQYYLDYMSSYAQHSYESYDEMVANASNLSENVSAFVTNDLDTAKNGIYTYNGTSFIKGDYQPEKAAKDYVDSKLGGLQVFEGKVRAQDVSTADGSTQAVKNTEFRSELDELPFEGGVLADTFVTSDDTLNQRQLNRGIASIFELILITNPKAGLKADVNSYHLNKNCGGGTFIWDATTSAALHNGGTIISPSAVIPVDWDNQEQVEAWLYPVGLTGTGCWVRQGTGVDNIQVFGALPDGVARVNLILERMTDLGIAIYVPKGIYRVEDFTRKLRGANNLDQKSMRIFGEETFGSTDQGYSWSSGSVFQGSGDMFKAIVNVRLDNLLFRNTPNGTLGKIFTLGGFAQCEWSNCIFGPSNYHIYNEGKGMAGYNVKPSYRNCRFYGAKEWSRYFEGVVANYREENCYTSTNKRGMYMACPMTTSIESCVYEYNEDGAITLDLYGYSTTYSFNMKDVFFESNGAGIFGSGTKSLPHIQIRTEDEGTGEPNRDAANLNFKQENCYYTDISSGEKAESNIFVYSKTVNIVEVQCWTELSLAEGTLMYSGSLSSKVDIQKQYPDTKVSIITISKEIRAKEIRAEDFITTTATPLKVVQGNTVVAGSACLVGYDKQVVYATSPVTYALLGASTYINGRLYVTVGEVYAEYTITGNSGLGVIITQVSMVGNTESIDIQIEVMDSSDLILMVKTLSTTAKFCHVSFIGSVGI